MTEAHLDRQGRSARMETASPDGALGSTGAAGGPGASDPERFLDGVEAVARRVKDAGMRFGLWMGFGQAHPRSRVALEHPEWLVTQGGRPIEGGWKMERLHERFPALYLAHLFPHTRMHAYVRGFTPFEERDATTYRSAFFGSGLYLLNDALLWDEETVEAISQQVARVKVDRELFRDGTVHDLLGTPPGQWVWEARFVSSAGLGRGMAQLFRNNDSFGSEMVRLARES